MLLFRDEHAQATLAQPASGRLSGGLAVFVPAPLSRGMQRSMLHVCYVDQCIFLLELAAHVPRVSRWMCAAFPVLSLLGCQQIASLPSYRCWS